MAKNTSKNTNEIAATNATKEPSKKRRKLITPVDVSFLIFINFSLFTAIYEEGFKSHMFANFVLMIIVVLLMISNNKKENQIMDLKEQLNIKD